MIYEIINPSDAYTMSSDDEDAAVLACLLLGNGAYGLKREDGVDVDCPMFIFGGNVGDWAEARFKRPIGEVIDEKSLAIADALDSVILGSFGDRKDVESAIAKMSPDNAREWMEMRHDRKRTSMNDIGSRAKKYAADFRTTRIACQEAAR